MTDETAIEQAQWFAMRDLKRPNAKCPAFRMLTESGFEVFTPMVTRLALTHSGKHLRLTTPAIHDLLFVRSVRSALDPVVARTPTLQYRFARGRGQGVPMTVRQLDMARFIHAVKLSQTPDYYSPSEITPDMTGQCVRIIGGPMDGYRGRLLAVGSTRTPRLLVSLDTFIAIAVEISPEYIAIIPE